jgi:broad specificity phosphatase PhoE
VSGTLVPFYFLRHGATPYNLDGVIQGSIDPPLAPQGREQARAAGGLLAGTPLALICTSPQRRAVETARLVAQVVDVPVTEVLGLEERHYGPFEGRPREERPDGRDVEGVEPWAGFTLRTVDALQRALSLADGRGPVLVVAHAGTCRALRAHLDIDHDYRSPVPNARPLLFTRDGERWRELAIGG